MSEWIECGLPWDGFTMVCGRLSPAESFNSRGLNKAGTLVEILEREGGASEIYLIGDINVRCGVCDDCRAFRDEAVVLRYRVVWEPEKSPDSPSVEPERGR